MTFTSVLIANRGEIASRVIRACREAGLRSIAVYSDADAGAPFVRQADDAVHLGPAVAAESYLSTDRLILAARAKGAEAIHPGYGFLSENAAFARAVMDAGLVWIGPPPDVMDQMARKDHARAIAERAGVPVTARYEPDAVPADAYPVLVKAAAGGGGKGMHIVTEPADLADALARAKREAAAAFGDDTVLIEQYVPGGRHVEVQVFGDDFGNVVHLAERDCSAQRRHQKVLEEAPAPGLSEAVRRTLHESSVALCREVGYVNAGTVEFLVAGEQAFFLEMNTRLQVEHPVTEEITGVDLVRWQLDVAAGKRLPLAQDDISVSGHALEVRVYAEDPYAGFLPQAGQARRVQWPSNARVESALESHMAVSTFYDPMLAKIIVRADTREAAIAAMLDALDDTAIFGVTTNVGFLRRLVASAEFACGQIDTTWLDGPGAQSLLTAPEIPAKVLGAAADAWLGASSGSQADAGPFSARDGWRLAAEPAPVSQPFWVGGQEYCVGPEYCVEQAGPVADVICCVDSRGVDASWQGQSWRLDVPQFVQRRAASSAGDAHVCSPMPGALLALDVQVGQRVERDQRLGTVEAMKMELPLLAPHDGLVAEISASVGDQLALGDPIVTVEPDTEADQ
jgi:acetyl-CoA/propionyl-CoA carboxylase biotin carboxyl carrier protein